MTKIGDRASKEWSITAKSILSIYRNFFFWVFRRPLNGIQLAEQFVRTLLEGFLTIVIGSVVMGMFIAWIGGYFGSLYGAVNYIGAAATFAILHEFTIMLVGLLYACRVGTAFTVEIGSMAMSGQLDAQRMMAVEPLKHIVIPRVVASVFSIVLLLAVSIGIGLVASAFFLQLWFNITFATVFDNAFMLVKPGTVIQAFVRIAIMGFFISLNACAVGFNFTGGAIELGKAATKSIVINFMYVMVIQLVTAILVTYSRWFTDVL
ncbi:MAG: ABC transporter permease [Spirochaetales bacterium]|nr:ABC transporter permease [Spirochaetales bacterium]